MKIRSLLLFSVISLCSVTIGWGQTWNEDLTSTMTATLDNGVLTITTSAASEAMPDFWWGQAPWYSMSESILSIVVAEHVTSIGNHAFQRCINLTSVKLPESLDIIGIRAFESCSSLPSITFPDGLTTIQNHAFFLCESLETLDIPASVSHIGEMAFDDCHALTAIHVDAANTAFVADDGVLYNIDKTAIVLYPELKSGTTFTIPNTVKVIESAAFNYSRLVSVTIPSTVTVIKYGAFWKNEKLTAITLPNSVEILGEEVFKYCSALTSITIPGSVKEIGYGAFSCCENLTSIEVEASSTAYLSEAGILYTKDKTELHSFPTGKKGTFIIPSTTEKIGILAFEESPLTAITIPESVTEIGNDAFRYCEGLTSVVIPESVTRIGNSAFHHCTNLTSVTLPDQLAEIEWHAFSQCINLAAITLPAKLQSIGDYAFYRCESLTSIEMPSEIKIIRYCAFLDCINLSSVTLSDAVETIERFAFAACNKLTSITLPASIIELEWGAFDACQTLKDVTVSWETPLLLVDNPFDEEIIKTATLHVPIGTTAAYQAANVWKEFGTFDEYDPAGNNQIEAPTLKAYFSNDLLYITGLQPGALLSIYSITGQLVYKGFVLTNSEQIPFHARGIYVVETQGRTVKISTN